MTDNDNVVPFQSPRRVFVRAFPGDEPCEGCPPDCGRPCGVDTRGTDVEFDDLVFIAERFMRQQLSQLNWREIGVKTMAGFLLDESDAESVARIAENARIEVFFDGV